jgi:glc operon protein GlcG
MRRRCWPTADELVGDGRGCFRWRSDIPSYINNTISLSGNERHGRKNDQERCDQLPRSGGEPIMEPDLRTEERKMIRAIVVAILSLCCFTAEAQTVSIQVLDHSGAQAVLTAAVRNAQARHAPSAIAVVDPAGDLLAFDRMDGVRPASVELAIQKARTAARLQRPTAEIEDNINHGRTAFVTANIPALEGGMPIRVDDQVVGAVGVAGLTKENDVDISGIAAQALSSPQSSAARQ